MLNWSPDIHLEPQSLLVVAYTDHYFGDNYVKDVNLPSEWNLDITCQFSYDNKLIDDADAIWFHGPSIRSLPPKKKGQKWIMMSMESDVNYPFLKDERTMDMFDIHMTYRLDSDVPTLYADRRLFNDFLDPPLPLSEKNKLTAPVLFIASNPVTSRDSYVKELMRYIKIDSPGRCLNNLDIPEFNADQNRWQQAASIIRQYKFYLSLENSQTKDYVTEKFFNPLALGTVPIYLGAENIAEFIPNEKSVICIQDYENPKMLAEYLTFLDNDDAAYKKHIAWKMEGTSTHFEQLAAVSSIEPKQRMFVKLAHGCDHHCTCGGRLRA